MNTICRLCRQRARGGLTAVELLLATALSTMLIVAVLGVLTMMNRQCRELVARTERDPWESLLAELLRRDFANARYIASSPDRLVLVGYLGTAGPELAATHRAAEVVYFVAPAGDVPCLLRDERPLAGTSGTRRSCRLVAADIAHFRFTQSGRTGNGNTYSGPVPKAGRILFFARNQTDPIAEIALCP